MIDHDGGWSIDIAAPQTWNEYNEVDAPKLKAPSQMALLTRNITALQSNLNRV